MITKGNEIEVIRATMGTILGREYKLPKGFCDVVTGVTNKGIYIKNYFAQDIFIDKKNFNCLRIIISTLD